MLLQSTYEISSIPIRLWATGKDGLMRYWIQGRKCYRQELACKMQFYSEIRGYSVSPNRRYLVVALHAETLTIDVATRKWRNLTRSRRYPDGSYTIEVVRVRSWAPNNVHFLARSWRTPATDIPIYSVNPPRLVHTVIASGEVRWAGWYPDSKHLYYALAPKEHEKQQSDPLSQPHYLLPITGGKPRKLSRQEVSRLLTDWDYLAFRGSEFVEPNRFGYTLDRNVRVVYNNDPAEKVGAIVVQRRGGEQRVLTIPNTANTPMRIRDIDADHQHLLVMDNYFNFFVVHIADNRWSRIGNIVSLVPGSQPGDVPEILVAEFVNTGYLFHCDGFA